LNEFLTRELAEAGYAGVEVRVTPARTEYVYLLFKHQKKEREKGGE
jgi:small subunit ribosomal protein S3e